MLPQRVLYYGKDEDLPAPTELRAGPLELLYDQGDLRYIRLGNTEILRRIFVAVRDRNWGTVPPVFSDVKLNVERDSFTVTYSVTNRQNEIDFAWRGSIRGEADGTITFHMEGEARSTFWRNRIGFCVLHPASLSGQPAVVEHVDGEQEPAVFPLDFVADQPVRPFAEMRAVTQPVAPGVRAEVRFAGDIFEMEDQRNWTDASYKTFSTPLRLPYPVEIPKGTRIHQSITIRLLRGRPAAGAAVPAEVRAEETPLLSIERGAPAVPVPCLGLGIASHGQPLTDNELARLRALHLHHLRVDLHPSVDDTREGHVRATLARAAEQARALGIGLEVALFVPAQAQAALETLRRVVEAIRPPVTAWLCYPENEFFGGGSPVGAALEAARAALESYDPAIPFCAGTNADFIFLKRSLPPLERTDRFCFAICPQVHAFDNASLVETLPMQGEAVRNARQLSQGRPVMVSPVALKMRSNPYATASMPGLSPGELPPQVDVRQISLFGAGWTLGSLKYLAEAGAACITYYETTGWRGVMERADGSPLPGVFRSLPGGVYPLYHVLAAVGDFAQGSNLPGSLLPVSSSQPLLVSGLCLRSAGAERVLIANHTPKALSVRLTGLRPAYHCMMLDENNVVAAMQSAEEFRRQPGQLLTAPHGSLIVELKPYAIASLDGVGDEE